MATDNGMCQCENCEYQRSRRYWHGVWAEQERVVKAFWRLVDEGRTVVEARRTSQISEVLPGNWSLNLVLEAMEKRAPSSSLR